MPVAAVTARVVAKDVNDAKTNGLHRQRVKPDLKPFIVQCIVTKTIPAPLTLQKYKVFLFLQI